MKTNKTKKWVMLFLVGIMMIPVGIGFAQTGISHVGTATFASTTPKVDITVAKPASAEAGDFLLAQIAFLKGSDISLSVPNGWTLIRRDDRESNIGSGLYYKFVGVSEPFQYTWGFSEKVSATASVTAYRGVYAVNPIIESSGRIGLSQYTRGERP